MNALLLASLAIFWPVATATHEDVLFSARETTEAMSDLFSNANDLCKPGPWGTLLSDYGKSSSEEDKRNFVRMRTKKEILKARELARECYYDRVLYYRSGKPPGWEGPHVPAQIYSETYGNYPAYLQNERVALVRIEKNVARIEAAYWDSNLAEENPTVGWIEKSDRVRIPFLKSSAPVKVALKGYEIASLSILLFLLSVTCAIHKRVEGKKENGGDGSDWIFFHPGLVGPTLGALWLLLPTFVACLGAWKGVLSYSEMGLLALLPTIVAISVLVLACRARGRFAHRC